jgi:hypothetical protein
MRKSLSFEASLQGSLNLAVMLNKAGQTDVAIETLAQIFEPSGFFARKRLPTDDRPFIEAKKSAELVVNLLSSPAMARPSAGTRAEAAHLAALLRVALEEQTGLLALLRATRDEPAAVGSAPPPPKLATNSRELVVLRNVLEKAKRRAEALARARPSPREPAPAHTALPRGRAQKSPDPAAMQGSF